MARLAGLVALVAAAACQPGVMSVAGPIFTAPPRGLDLALPVPHDNPLTAESVALGRALFSDPRLSRDGTVSCASCHDPARAFTDGRPVPVGIGGRTGRRNAPTLLNRAYERSLFWDGRVRTLEEQALLPMTNPDELGSTHAAIVARLRENRSHREWFARVYGTDTITIEQVAMAIAAFERTLLSGDSAFDRYLLDRNPQALSPEARRGFALFRGRARCLLCHDGPLFTDHRFHNTGVAWMPAAHAYRDVGRYAVTGRDDDRGAFRTPSLRDVALTAPYMHDGSLSTLDAVIAFYDGGGRPNPNLDGSVRPLNLSGQNTTDLVAFLKSLTGRSRWN